MSKNVFRLKCLIIGESTAGKTSIVKALTGLSNPFSNKYLMTTDIEISVKKLKLPNSEQTIELYLYDCSGKDFYRQILRNIWSNDISLIVGVFDVTNEESLNLLHNWLSDAFKANAKEKMISIVLGNKIDLEERVIVRSDEAHQLAKKYKTRYFECSAKQGTGIEEAFLHLVTVWYELHNKVINNSEKEE